MDLLFDGDTGLGVNAGKYLIEGGENSDLYFIQFRDMIPNYEPKKGEWDWNTDPYQVWITQAALEKGMEIVMAFTNSPPYWMTYSRSATGNYLGLENLKSAYYDELVNYMVTVVDYFSTDLDIKFECLEMFNEPMSDWWVYGGTQEGCMIDINTQQAIIPLTAAALAVSESSTVVAASDDNDIDQSYYNMLAFISSGNLDHISQINTHTYSGTLRTVQQLAAQYNKKLWASEYGDADGSGLTLAQQLMTDLTGLRPLVW